MPSQLDKNDNSDFQFNSSRFKSPQMVRPIDNLPQSSGGKSQVSETLQELNALPSGKAFKEGSKILLPAKAFDVYHMNALYADTNNISGEVREINGNLYAKGENPIIEYTPKEQIIQPNNHISGAIKNAEADKRLEALKHDNPNGDMSISAVLPNILLGAIAGAISGALLHSPLLMIGSLGVGGASIHLANEHFKKSSHIENDDFKKKIANFS